MTDVSAVHVLGTDAVLLRCQHCRAELLLGLAPGGGGETVRVFMDQHRHVDRIPAPREGP